jgi:bacteriocin biosynthesis cyclodehydratase domain-containing protein
MTDRDLSGGYWKDGMKLPRRFSVLKIADSEYKLVSLYEMVGVRLEKTGELLLERVFRMLQAGARLGTILHEIDPAHHQTVIDVLNDLMHRGLLSPVSDDGGEPATHVEQLRFFANFRPLSGAPPGAEGSEPSDPALNMQRRLGKAHVLIVGLGRVGSRLTNGLVHAGVGRITGCDPARLCDEDLIDSGHVPSEAHRSREEALGSVIQKGIRDVDYRPLRSPLFWEAEHPVLPEDLDLLVMCEDVFDPARYAVINRLCLEQKITWISARNLGSRVEIGPLIVPEDTACFKCLELRKTGNLVNYTDFLATQHGLARSGVGCGALDITLGYEVLALEIIKILTDFSRPATYGTVYSFDLVTLEVKLRPVLKISRCPACGGASRDRPTPGIWDRNALFDQH